MKHFRTTAGTSILLAVSTVMSIGATPSAVSVASAKTKPVTLNLIMWHNDASVKALKTIDAAFHAKYPNITVNEVDVSSDQWNQLEQTRLAAKDVDIVATQAFTGGTSSWAPKAQRPTWQQQLDANLFLKLNGQPFLKRYYRDAIQNASTYKGGIYGVETGAVAVNGVFYNESIFKKYHLSPPKTWPEFVHIMSVLKAHNVTPFIMGGKDGWPQGLPFLGIFSNEFPNVENEVRDIWNGKAHFTDPGWIVTYSRLSTIWSYTEKNYLGVGYDQAQSYFTQGHAAMLPDGTWALPNLTSANPKFKFGFFAIPGDNAANSNFLAGKYDLQWMVTSFSPHKDAALKWLSFFSQPANYKLYVNATGFIPTQAGIKANLPGDAGRDILRINKHFKLELDQATVTRQGVMSGQPGDFFDYNLLVPQGTLSPLQLAMENQKAWDATASLN